MYTRLPTLPRFLQIGLLLAGSLFCSTAHAQAQYAGTYIGTINIKVSVPAAGFSTENTSGAYIAVVSSTGTIDLSGGALTGTVSASGAVSFTGGTSLATLGITSGTISGNQLTSNYGNVVGNGTTQFKLNGSTAFNASGTGGGTVAIANITSSGEVTGTVGQAFTYVTIATNNPTSYSLAAGAPSWLTINTTTGVVTGTPPTAGSFAFTVRAVNSAGTATRAVGLVVTAVASTTGDLLAYYSFDDANNLLKDDSGRGNTLAPVGGVVTQTTGKYGAGSLRTSNVRLRALLNSSFSTGTMTLSAFVKPTGAGNWNPRLLAVGYPGTSAHYYGMFLDGTSSTRRFAFLGNNQISTQQNSTGTIANNAWYHLAVTFEAGSLKFYLNGQLDRTIATGAALTRFNTALLMIAGSDNGLDLFTGDMDEVRIYNRALTGTEVSSLNQGVAVGSVTAGSGTGGILTGDVVAAPSNLTGYRSRVGQSISLSVTGGLSGSVWGTDIYTDDSNVAAAAVHAGVVGVGETKTVSVSILPGQGSYTASVRNGVSTGSWGAWTGSFSFAGTGGTSYTGGTVATASLAPGFTLANVSVTTGGRLVFPISVTGIGPFVYQWYLNGVLISGATANPYVVESASSANSGTYTVRVTNPGGSQTFTAGTVNIAAAGAPSFLLQPFDKVVAPGGTFALAATAAGSGLSYQWLRNGNALSGETGPILLRQSVNAGDIGAYSVRVTNSSGSVTSQSSNVSLDPNASTLRNLSVRTNAGASQVLITGVTISGVGKKRVIVRAVGPGLSAFLSGGMSDPKLAVFDGSTQIAANDNWDGTQATANAFAAVGAFGITPGSKDAALIVELTAGKGYTFQISSANNQGGIVLVEVYDADTAPTSKLTNVSVRSISAPGADVLIMGVSLQGVGKRTLLVRGIGPTLASFGVSGTLADPKLAIFDKDAREILSNNDWNGADFVSEMLQAQAFVGAFNLTGGSADASTLSLLDPGTYTIQVSGNDNGSGEALVELYEVP